MVAVMPVRGSFNFSAVQAMLVGGQRWRERYGHGPATIRGCGRRVFDPPARQSARWRVGGRRAQPAELGISVAVGVGLVGALHRDTDVVRLALGEVGELGAYLG